MLLDAQRTATDDPKSKASRRTISAEEVQPETVALQRTSRARQAADRLKAGAGYTETGLVFLRPPEKGCSVCGQRPRSGSRSGTDEMNLKRQLSRPLLE